jgi:hypothetical protein
MIQLGEKRSRAWSFICNPLHGCENPISGLSHVARAWRPTTSMRWKGGDRRAQVCAASAGQGSPVRAGDSHGRKPPQAPAFVRRVCSCCEIKRGIGVDMDTDFMSRTSSTVDIGNGCKVIADTARCIRYLHKQPTQCVVSQSLNSRPLPDLGVVPP